MAPLPAIGRIVHFRSRTGMYTVPAMIVCNIYSLNPEGVAAGNIALLSHSLNVHLTVFTPGLAPAGVGSRASAPDFVTPSTAKRNVPGTKVVPGDDGNLTEVPLGVIDMPVGENLGGTYQEWDVPFWDPSTDDFAYGEHRDGLYLYQDAGSWTWPVRS